MKLDLKKDHLISNIINLQKLMKDIDTDMKLILILKKILKKKE